MCYRQSHVNLLHLFQKSQPNGRAVVEPQEEAIVTEEIVPHHHPPTPEVKTEKAAEVIHCSNTIIAGQIHIDFTYYIYHNETPLIGSLGSFTIKACAFSLSHSSDVTTAAGSVRFQFQTCRSSTVS